MKPLKSRSWSDEERRVRLDALMLWWPYADGALRGTIDALIDEAKAGEWTEENEMFLLRVAAATWPMRQAAKRYAQAEPKRFWDLFVPRCLPTTQVLLQGLAEKEGTTVLKKLLASPLADLALHEAERLEIELLQPQIQALAWKEYGGEMSQLVEDAKRERDEKQALLHGTTDAKTLSAFEHEMMYG